MNLRRWVWIAACWFLTGCGTPQLPAFARPPDPDAGARSDDDAGSERE